MSKKGAHTIAQHEIAVSNQSLNSPHAAIRANDTRKGDGRGRTDTFRDHKLLPFQICTLGGRHPDANHSAVMSIASVLAPRAMIHFGTARLFLFQRHAAQLVAGCSRCFMQGWAIEVQTERRVAYIAIYLSIYVFNILGVLSLTAACSAVLMANNAVHTSIPGFHCRMYGK